MKNSISFILCSKNDNYEKDSLSRLQKSLSHNLQITSELDREFIITDWGSDIPLSEVIEVEEEYKNLVFWNYIPKKICCKYDSSFVEVLALNNAARKANKNFIARLDQDIVVGDIFVNSVLKNEYKENEFYFSNRRDFSQNQQLICKPEFVKLSPFGDPYYHYAVGILMMPRKLWFDVRGYNENMIYYCHMEHDFIKRCLEKSNLINLGLKLNYDFYHIYHDRSQGRQKKLNDANTPFTNNENWGILS
jgi:hypothetical protein